MSSALVATSLEQIGTILIYTSGERDEQGKVIPGTERITYSSPGRTLAEKSFQKQKSSTAPPKREISKKFSRPATTLS